MNDSTPTDVLIAGVAREIANAILVGWPSVGSARRTLNDVITRALKPIKERLEAAERYKAPPAPPDLDFPGHRLWTLLKASQIIHVTEHNERRWDTNTGKVEGGLGPMARVEYIDFYPLRYGLRDSVCLVLMCGESQYWFDGQAIQYASGDWEDQALFTTRDRCNRKVTIKIGKLEVTP